jgi:hypothetical protein
MAQFHLDSNLQLMLATWVHPLDSAPPMDYCVPLLV